MCVSVCLSCIDKDLAIGNTIFSVALFSLSLLGRPRGADDGGPPGSGEALPPPCAPRVRWSDGPVRPFAIFPDRFGSFRRLRTKVGNGLHDTSTTRLAPRSPVPTLKGEETQPTVKLQ